MRKSIAEDAAEGDGDEAEAEAVCFSPPGEQPAASPGGEAAAMPRRRRRSGTGGEGAGRGPSGLKPWRRRRAAAREGTRAASEVGLQRKKARPPLPIFFFSLFSSLFKF